MSFITASLSATCLSLRIRMQRLRTAFVRRLGLYRANLWFQGIGISTCRSHTTMRISGETLGSSLLLRCFSLRLTCSLPKLSAQRSQREKSLFSVEDTDLRGTESMLSLVQRVAWPSRRKKAMEKDSRQTSSQRVFFTGIMFATMSRSRVKTGVFLIT